MPTGHKRFYKISNDGTFIFDSHRNTIRYIFDVGLDTIASGRIIIDTKKQLGKEDYEKIKEEYNL